METSYFQDFAKGYKGTERPVYRGLGFKTLKCLEFWMRGLIRSSADRCEEEGFDMLMRMMSEKGTDELLDKLADRRREQLEFRKHKEESYGIKKGSPDYDVPEEADDEVLSNIRRVRFRGRSSNGFRSRCLVGNLISDDKNRELIIESFLKDGERQLAEADISADPTYARALALQREFSLTDQELNYVLFIWLCDDRSVLDELGPLMGVREPGGNNASRNPLFRLLFDLSNFEMEKLIGNEARLVEMGVVRNASTAVVIDDFLGCVGSSDLCRRFYSIYNGPCIPFAELSQGRKEYEILLESVRNHCGGRRLNVLLYGVEGTGKSELSKAVAKELNLPLLEINLDIQRGSSDEDRNRVDPVYNRLAAIHYADYKYRDKDAIIAVDEADSVLNGCEKGFLNLFMEKLHHPVLWISNKIREVEASSLRRFDYSIAFEPFDQARRESVWRSVIEAQDAADLVPAETVTAFAHKMHITAGGINQAVGEAKLFKECGSAFSPECVIQAFASAQSKLMGLRIDGVENAAHGAGYDLNVLNVGGDLPLVNESIEGFNAVWDSLKEEDAPRSLNILLFGPPGTGKTEYVRHLSRKSGRPLIIKHASDLLDCFVGNTEKRIAAAFDEAERTKSILFFDEADSFFADRSGASHNWEVTQVNELLMRMENFKGIFIAATNFNDNFDAASRRRFALKVRFDYLTPDGIEKMWALSFPQVSFPEQARRLQMLAPGDFNAVYNRVRYLAPERLTPESLMQALEQEIAAKNPYGCRKMGL